MTNRSQTNLSADRKALLEAANQASSHVSALHIAFMALCSYILVIVFGTTDLDLLIGKGIKLPVVDVEVPIVAFYGTAPTLVVIVHFNLLLQLQLLSHKLHAFEEAASKASGICKLVDGSRMVTSSRSDRDLLHIFPYSHYLVGQPGSFIQQCLGLVVGITILVLPLITLLALQLRFLAYQSPVVTWTQRIGVWADVAAVVALWPVVMDRGDQWLGYHRRIWTTMMQRKTVALYWLSLSLVGALAFFTQMEILLGAAVAGAIATLLSVFLLKAVLFIARQTRFHSNPSGHRRPFVVPPVQGMLAYMFVAIIGLVTPLAFFIKGEALETYVLRGSRFVDDSLISSLRTLRFNGQLWKVQLEVERTLSSIGKNVFESWNQFRFISIPQHILSGRPTSAVSAAKSGIAQGTDEFNALTSLDRIHLSDRNLQGADFTLAILIEVDLRRAHLEGAEFWGSQLYGVDLTDAHLDEANFRRARLVGETILSGAHFKKTNLKDAIMPGISLRFAGIGNEADLGFTDLTGADLRDAHLENCALNAADLMGANLANAKLNGAYLKFADLRGADLHGADLQGANLNDTKLEGADFREAKLYGASFVDSDTALVDLRGAQWTRADRQEAQRAGDNAKSDAAKGQILTASPDSQEASVPVPLAFKSCLVSDTANHEFPCDRYWKPGELVSYQEQLYKTFEGLACRATPIARSLLFFDKTESVADEMKSARTGFPQHMAALLADPWCEGLRGLTALEKEKLHSLKR
ncbi:hypothetical protein BYI23_D015500 (plasmid) [Burkholderia sp. YI23]|nr:hypothetical protein BYI23_D015500 [Burkholderia sp. YI23]